ncbi:MAG: hypothetical protein DRI57_00070 [Deltaproteobacteria bacterium]|nr:MAG: hypothetical protein DRI57_00070 [Deltaproteobacteria bacterium]
MALSEKSKNPFVTIAWSNELVWIMTATGIWGLFPLFFHFMGGFESDFPSIYLFLRYLITGVIFLPILFIFIVFSKKLRYILEFVKTYRKSLLYGGIVLFATRFFETLAFKEDIVTFATIFCVALVPLTEPLVVLLYRCPVIKGVFVYVFGEKTVGKMAFITQEKENYWLEYCLTFSVIFSTAMFFIYGMEGKIALISGYVPFYAYIYVILAAMALQLYFHNPK